MAVQVCDSTGAKLRGVSTESSDAARAWVRYGLERLQTAEALGEAPPRTLRKPGDDFWLQVIYAARGGSPINNAEQIARSRHRSSSGRCQRGSRVEPL